MRIFSLFPTILFVFLAAGALVPAPAKAQSEWTGAIAGAVTGSATGEPISDATIRVRRLPDGAEYRAISDERGRFMVPALPPGPYVAVVEAFSYIGVEERRVEVVAGEAARLDVQMTTQIFIMDGMTVTATREREPVMGVPSTVAMVDSIELAERPTVSLADHLRSAPGVDQISYGLQSSNVVTRGFNNLFSGALHTLTDYRIASVPSLRVNLLHMESATNEDLERMEIVLGPGAALYGPNTANGVLHIITRSPLEHQGTRASVAAGERDVLQQSFRTAHLVGDDVGVKVSGQRVTGTEWQFVDPDEKLARERAEADPEACAAGWMAGGVSAGEASLRCGRTGDRSFQLERWAVDGRLDWRMAPGWTTVLSSGMSRAVSGIELTGIGAAQTLDWTKYFYQARTSSGRFFAQTYLNGSDAGDTYLLQNGASIADRSKLFVAQAQHGLFLGERHDLTYGVDYLRTMPVTGGTINGRNEDDDLLFEVGAYVHSRTTVSPTLDLILAGRFDHTSAIENLVFSPRAGLVFSPSPAHSLRATFNSAFQTPTSLNMFLDIHAGAVPDASLAGLGFAMRAQGPGTAGIDLVGDNGELLGMRSPFNPAGAGALLPAQSAALWQLAVGVMRAEGMIDDATAADFMALDASGLGINALDPNTGAVSTLAAAGIRNVPRISESRQTTYEIGYNGPTDGSRLMLTADAWYTEKSNFISPLMAQTPFLLIEGQSTVEMLVPYFMGRGMTQQQAVTTAKGMVQGDPDVVGDGIAEVPLGVASSNDVNAVGADMLLTYRNFGRVTLWGADLAATLLLGDRWSVGLSGSWVSDDHFRVPLQGTEQVVALNAPSVKASTSFGFRDPAGGFNGEARVRYHNAFPANSAGYTGLACVGVGSTECVQAVTLADLTLGYRLPVLKGASLQLSVQNLFDEQYRSFVRVPAMGRLALLRLSYEF